MQRVEYRGIYSDAFYIALPETGPIQIRIITQKYGPDFLDTSLSVDQVALAPDADLSIVDSSDFSERVSLTPLIIVNESADTHVIVPNPEGPRGLALYLDTQNPDFDASWSLRVIVSPLDTSPLVFEPLSDTDALVSMAGKPGVLTNTGPTLIYDEAAPTGILIPAGMLELNPETRQVTLLPGALSGYDLEGGLEVRPMTLTEGVTFSLDDATIPGYALEGALPATLGAATLYQGNLDLDARGAVFEFSLVLPEDLGGGLYQPREANGAPAVLDITGQVLGEGRWDFTEMGGPVADGFAPWLGLFDLVTGTAQIVWDEAGERLTVTGDVIMSDPFQTGQNIAFYTTPEGGFYSDAAGAGLDGPLSLYWFGFEEAGLPVYLNELSLALPPGGGAGDLVASAEMVVGLGGVMIYLPETLAAIVFDPASRSIASLTVEVSGLTESMQLGDFVLTDFKGVLFPFAGDGETLAAELDMEGEISLRMNDEATGAVLALLQVAGEVTSDGLAGTAQLEVYDTNGTTLLASVAGSGQSLGGIVADGGLRVLLLDTDLMLPVLGSVEGARIEASQGFGEATALQLRGTADITLPSELLALFDVEGQVRASIDGSVDATSGSESWIAAIAELGSSWLGAGEFGVRASLDGETALIGGLGFGDADIGTIAARSAEEPGVQRYQLDSDTEGLAMRAKGAVDAGEVTVTGPDGSVYTAANFAARGIVVINEDDSGITLLVPQAEAGEWVLTAASATGFAGYADFADLTLELGTVLVDGVPTLRAEAGFAGPAMPPDGYAWRVYADRDGSGLDGQLVYQIDASNIDLLEIPVSDLGLPPGEWHFHATLGSGNLAPVSAYALDPATVSGVADLSITADLIWTEREGEGDSEGDFPMLNLAISNLGDAPAVNAFVDLDLPGFEGFTLNYLAPGETVLLELDTLRDLGLTRGAEPLMVSISPTGFEQNRANNVTLTRSSADAGLPARPDRYALEEDGSLSGQVTANDGPGVTAVDLVRGPLNGTLVLQGDGSFTYQPNADYFGPDVFTYAVTTAQGLSEARVWLMTTPVNDAPEVVASLQDLPVMVGRAMTLDLSRAISDVEAASAADTLVYALTLADGGALPGWMLFDEATGQMSGTPPANAGGRLDLRLTATDFAGAQASDVISIRVLHGVQGGAGAEVVRGDSRDNWLIAEAGDDGLLAGAGDDLLEAGAGDDILQGGRGADTMTGGEGDDRYRVDDAGDNVIETASGGQDKVLSTLDWTLGVEIEALRLLGTADLQGIGNAGDNRIEGNAGGNLLQGLDGADLLIGGQGADALEGGDGDDRLVGGAGADQLRGGAGADRFIFRTLSDSAPEDIDSIADFEAGLDRIDLRGIDANALSAGDQAFAYVGALDFSATGAASAGQLRASLAPGGEVRVEGDVDGDGTSDFAILLAGATLPEAAAFLL